MLHFSVLTWNIGMASRFETSEESENAEKCFIELCCKENRQPDRRISQLLN